jgi:hypothetical protein
MLHDLPQGGELAPFVNQRHAEGDLGEGLSFVWEQHEACGITLFIRDPSADPSAALHWLERFPGQAIRATRMHIVADEAEAERVLPRWASSDPIWSVAISG